MTPFLVWCPEWGQDSVKDAELCLAQTHRHAALAYIEKWDTDGWLARKCTRMQVWVRNRTTEELRAITIVGAGMKPAYTLEDETDVP